MILFQSICRIFLFALSPCSKILLNFWDRLQMLRKKHIFNLVRQENSSMYEYMLFWTSSSLRFCILCSRLQIWTWDGAVLSWIFTFLFVRTTRRTYWWNTFTSCFLTTFFWATESGCKRTSDLNPRCVWKWFSNRWTFPFKSQKKVFQRFRRGFSLKSY